MGGAGSTFAALEANTFLRALADPDTPLPPTAWKDGLASLASIDFGVASDSRRDLVHILCMDNLHGGRLLELARQTGLALSTAICNKGDTPPHLPSAIALTRLCVAHAITSVKGNTTALSLHFPSTKLLVESLVGYLIEVPLTPTTIATHSECVSCLLTMCGTLSYSTPEPYFVGFLFSMPEDSQAQLAMYLLRGYGAVAISGPTRRWWWRRRPATPDLEPLSRGRQGMWLLLTLLYCGKATVARPPLLRHVATLSGLGMEETRRSLALMRPQCEEAWLATYFFVYDNNAFRDATWAGTSVVGPALHAIYNDDAILPETLYMLLTTLMHLSQGATWNALLHATPTSTLPPPITSRFSTRSHCVGIPTRASHHCSGLAGAHGAIRGRRSMARELDAVGRRRPPE